MKKLILFVLLAACGILFAGCAAMGDYEDSDPDIYESGDSYLEITENTFVKTLDDPVSTFSLNNSTAGYANIRRMINNNQQIPKDSVKIEELVNYFNYDYESPQGDNALNIQAEMMICPWNTDNKIISFGIKAKELEFEEDSRNNLVFLLDVSGSMNYSNKIGLMKNAFKLFSETLNQNDVVSIVTYASSDLVLLEGANGSDHMEIVHTIEDLTAEGMTAGASGIQTAYEIASQYFIEGGNNRVILATDGDFNVGISDITELGEFISEKRGQGIYLSVLGFGYGNLRDDTLETLANHGDGNYAYIDSINEAKKVLIEEIGGTLNVVAKDAKAQVTFNPKYIKEYRLLGYENKIISDEEFEDPNTDAGEIGAGHVVTAVYEIVMNDVEETESTLGTDYAQVLIRFKDPENFENKEISALFNENIELPSPSEDLLFVSGVIEFGLLLRDSPHKGNASYNEIIQRLSSLSSVEEDSYKSEFLELVEKAR